MDSLDYEDQLFNVENDVQDRTSMAWKKLCEYVEKVARNGTDEFSPYEYLGKELYAQIHTLPETIAKLKKVKKMLIGGSQLKLIPPEIGEMESLKYFEPYCSYHLHWLPYEIINCKNLKDSTVSTRALYGNYKYRRPFPDLTHNPVRYEGDTVKCSICKKEMSYQETEQFWISLVVGSDVLPLLANLCSEECKNKLPIPPEGYVSYAHKGGENLVQPPDEDNLSDMEMEKKTEEEQSILPPIEKQTEIIQDKDVSFSDFPLLKLIRKIWEK